MAGDADNDGDTLDDGPGAFALCVAGKLGVGGWAAIGGSAFSAYQVWDARSSTRQAETRYNDYAMLAGHDPAVAHIYYVMWQDAKDSEAMMWKALGVTSGIAAAELVKAAAACSATALIPI
ncbi:hypothetical protein [Longimicrobium terrae]|uniref:Uncharacterized protein n=1 Tax=Longimicrobium terrae TaxID=1639882 RepID=A0A841GXG2_9BACT|nr:hypothetical protein [Longimicrobium terrae]MBB4635910.1 hypothetical protein [Longimicrobium terrae]MBB6070306.1 hypothetical protein [Longimicrobium terrae]NNC30808.1 hypothetical protein [Longimicrobium terrae]